MLPSEARESELLEDRTRLGMFLAELPAQFNHTRQAIDHHYPQLLRRDGADGRDPDDVRNPKQRLADSVFELLTNRDADTGEAIDYMPSVKAKAATQVILVAPMGEADGTDRNGHVEMIGVGPVPREILETLTPDTELAGMVFDRAGLPLWLGRNQRLAVAVRDGGCFAMPQCTAANSTTSKSGTATTAVSTSTTWLPSAANTKSGSKPRISSSSGPQRLRSPTPRRPRALTRRGCMRFLLDATARWVTRFASSWSPSTRWPSV